MVGRLALAAALVAGALAVPAAARAQSVSSEVDLTIGASTDETTASSVQARLFGASASDWRFYLEGSWAQTAGEHPSDVFASSYPYDGQLRPMELYGEKTRRAGRALIGVRAGRYRTPFGIGGRSDHAYSCFLRPPLIRYGTNFALSNTFLEAGGEVLIGVPALHVQTSISVPRDEGADRRTHGLTQVIRAQAYARNVILGASYLRTPPSDPRPFATGRMVFRGVDVRWMHGGVELRGEWIDGRPFDGVVTRGGYLDAMVRHPGLGRVTAVARVERLDYDAGPFSQYSKRLTVGARLRMASWLVGQANVVRQPGGLAGGRSHALDVSFTFSRRF